MPMGMPLDSSELMNDIFRLLIVHSDDVIFSSCAELFSIDVVVHSHCVVSLLKAFVYFLSSFRNVLINVAVCICNQNN